MDLALEVELGDALVWVGKTSEAIQRADTFAEWAGARGDRLGELCGRIRGGGLRLILGEVASEQLAALVEQALTEFQAAGDDLALYIAHVTYSDIEWTRGRDDSALQAYERAISHAQRAGHHPVGSLGMRAAFRFFGSTAASDMLAWLDANEPQPGRNYFLRAYRAGALAMLGRFDEARAILAEDRVELEQRGGGVLLANITAFESVWVELWAGDPAAAARFGEEGWRLHVGAGESFALSLAAGTLSRSLYELDRLDDAEAWADRARELARGQPWEEIVHRQVKAKLLARRGEHAEAERLAREAVTICNQTERLDLQGDVYADLAEVMLLAGNTEDATAALKQALDRYRRKENLAMVKQVRHRLNALQKGTSGQRPMHTP
jgi:tetratricopeptide (TPR) repeat protein